MRIGTYLDQTQAMVKMCSQKFDLHMRSICTSKCFACVWAHASHEGSEIASKTVHEDILSGKENEARY